MKEYTIDDLMKKIRPKKKGIDFLAYSEDNFMESEQVLTLLLEEVVTITNKNIELEESIAYMKDRIIYLDKVVDGRL